MSQLRYSNKHSLKSPVQISHNAYISVTVLKSSQTGHNNISSQMNTEFILTLLRWCLQHVNTLSWTLTSCTKDCITCLSCHTSYTNDITQTNLAVESWITQLWVLFSHLKWDSVSSELCMFLVLLHESHHSAHDSATDLSVIFSTSYL